MDERWIIVRNGRQVYPGEGIRLEDAERIAAQLLDPADLYLANPEAVE